MPVLAPISTKSKIATPVVSLPVPAVVGTAIRGLRGPGTGIPCQAEDFTIVEKICRVGSSTDLRPSQYQLWIRRNSHESIKFAFDGKLDCFFKGFSVGSTRTRSKSVKRTFSIGQRL